MARMIVISTYNKADVLEPERVFRYKGHSLNQLQKRCFDWHVRRLNTIVDMWRYSGATFRVQFIDGTGMVCRLKPETFPTIRWKKKGMRWQDIDLYGVYNILPALGENLTLVPDYYPYMPSNREFYYMSDITDFRQLHDRNKTPLHLFGNNTNFGKPTDKI